MAKKPQCNDCGETRLTWQFSRKGKWYLQQADGKPHFLHCVVALARKNGTVPAQPTDAEVELAQSEDYQADLVAEFQSQTDYAFTSQAIEALPPVVDELGMLPHEHDAVEQQIANAKPLIVADLMKAFSKPDAIKPNPAVRDVYRASEPVANPLPVKQQAKPISKPTTQANGQPVNIPCPKCRQPNKLTFQQLTANITCC